MYKYIIILLLFVMPTPCFGQVMGFAGQMTAKDKGQFATNLSLPYINGKVGNYYLVAGSGIEYTSSNAKISGLNLKAFSMMVTSEHMSRKGFGTVALGLDTGYNFNLAYGNDGIIVTPHVYMDFLPFYIKAGYDYNTFHNEGQIFVRAGICWGWGLTKLLMDIARF